MINSFFRKDLNLNNKWWHRLLKVLFYTSFILVVFVTISVYSTDNIFTSCGVPQWEIVEPLKNRITSTAKPIKNMIKNSEKIAEGGEVCDLNFSINDYYLRVINDVYCSLNLSAELDEIIKMSGPDYLYIRDVFGKVNISKEKYLDYIVKNDINCVVKDSYGGLKIMGGYN